MYYSNSNDGNAAGFYHNLQADDGPEIRGGPIDALIVQATTATKGKKLCLYF